MNIDYSIIDRLKKKAKKSWCRFKISAIGFNSRGEFIGITCNKPRFEGKGRGSHAEMQLMMKYRNVKSMVICRTNAAGDLLPIGPCPMCAGKAKELGIKIMTLKEVLK